MAYDKALDREVFGKDIPFETTKIRVSIMSYNEGEPKIQLGRMNLNVDSGDWRYSKLGRLTAEEAKGVHEALAEALSNL